MTATKRPYQNSLSADGQLLGRGRRGIIDLLLDASDLNSYKTSEKKGQVKLKPPIDPLLLLAIVSQLSRDHSAIMDFAGLRGSEEGDEKMFHGPFKEILKTETVVRSIAKRWGQKLIDDATDYKKKKEIASLLR